MEAYSLESIFNALVILATGGATFRFIFCLLKIAFEEDDSSYRLKARNTLIFLVIAVTAKALVTAITSYFGGTFTWF